MNFCIKCGTELHGAPVCPNCGAVYNETKKAGAAAIPPAAQKNGLKAFIHKCGLVDRAFLIKYAAAILGVMISPYLSLVVLYDVDYSFFEFWSFNIHSVTVWLQLIAIVCAWIMYAAKPEKMEVPVFGAVCLGALKVLDNLFGLFSTLLSPYVELSGLFYELLLWEVPFLLLAGIPIYFINKIKSDAR